MSFWKKLVQGVGDVVAASATLIPTTLGINLGQDKLYSSSKTADKIMGITGTAGKVIAGATAATIVGPTLANALGGLTNKQKENAILSNVVPSATAANDAVKSPYKDEESILATIAKAVGGVVNIGKDGNVTGQIKVGTEANPAAVTTAGIGNAIAKYWWVLVLVAGAVLIFRGGRR